MQDPDPLPWGALDRFQAHFIVRAQVGANVADYMARVVLDTEGHFGGKHIKGVRWSGGRLADVLNEDDALNEAISGQPLDIACITIDPTDDMVRIYSRWQNRDSIGISAEMFGIYDKIAGYIRGL